MIPNHKFQSSLSSLQVLILSNKLKKLLRKKEIVSELSLENLSSTFPSEKDKMKLPREELKKEIKKDTGLCFKIFI
jgi:hypothetical protein